MKKILVFVCVIAYVLCSCGGSADGTMSREDHISLIDSLEDEAFGEGGNFNATMALSLINNYAQFATQSLITNHPLRRSRDDGKRRAIDIRDNQGIARYQQLS
jgi:hypothetical protein